MVKVRLRHTSGPNVTHPSPWERHRGLVDLLGKDRRQTLRTTFEHGCCSVILTTGDCCETVVEFSNVASTICLPNGRRPHPISGRDGVGRDAYPRTDHGR
jgi:hypothetical protein